jgi:outer membrane protein OmpA-like peptidoglycan-associated protein
MRRPSNYRGLNSKEKHLCLQIFGYCLPSFDEIGIGDGLGLGDRPFTDSGNSPYPGWPNLNYQINLGDVMSSDLTSRASTTPILGAYFGTISDLFVHEMTHVWQEYNGLRSQVIMSSIYAQIPLLGAGYDIPETSVGPWGAWKSYNREQQASIVEQWWHEGGTKEHHLYPYISQIIQKCGADHETRSKELYELTPLVLDLDSHEAPVEPVRITQKDDTFAIQIHGDVLFDFGKDILKPTAQPVLAAAGVQIDAKPGWRVSVEGHTDSIGGDAVNLDLSKRRAIAVLGWLTTHGFLKGRIAATTGWGKAKPVEPNTMPGGKDNPKGRQLNRRVEIVLMRP